MSAKIVINKEQITQFLEQNQWDELSQYLDTNFKLILNENGKPVLFEYSPHIKEVMCELILTLCNLVQQNEDEKHLYKLCASIFRALRNYALDEHSQNAFINDDSVSENMMKLLVICLKNHSQGMAVTKLILQFFCNCTIYAQNKDKILKLLGPRLLDTLNSLDLMHISSAIIYNVIKDINIDLNTVISDNIFSMFLNLYDKHYEQNEYLTFIMEILVNNEVFVTNYSNYDTDHKFIILDILEENIPKPNFMLNPQVIKILIDKFKNSSDVILKTADSNFNEFEAREISKIIHILSSLSGNEKYLQYLQKDKSLIISCAYMLTSIHMLGKNSENNFSAIQRLSEFKSPNEDISQHPAFGVKGCLIRILGNVCWKNKENQDQLRELDVIPVILDCCNMDARNPFIIQWAVLAVRNMCNNNVENQKIIASLTQQGTVSSAALQEMGLTLHNDGNKDITVVPLDTLRNLK